MTELFKWNSKPFLVITEKFEAEARQLLEGSFHEIEHVARIVSWRIVKELYELEKKAVEIKKEVGIQKPDVNGYHFKWVLSTTLLS